MRFSKTARCSLTESLVLETKGIALGLSVDAFFAGVKSDIEASESSQPFKRSYSVSNQA